MRVVTALFVCLLGGLGLLINLFGFAMNGPFEPPMGMTSKNIIGALTQDVIGSNRHAPCCGLGRTFWCADSHRWVIQRAFRYRVVMGILLLPLVILVGRLCSNWLWRCVRIGLHFGIELAGSFWMPSFCAFFFRLPFHCRHH